MYNINPYKNDGVVAIKGWVEKSEYTTLEFFEKMQNIGVATVICTDISKDGAMQGTNRALYKTLSEQFVRARRLLCV